MPTFRITGPDGTKYRVTTPEGVSQEDVLKYVQQQHTPKVASTPEAPVDPLEGETENYFDIPTLSMKQRPASPFVPAVGSGMVRAVRGGGNLLLRGLNAVLPSDPDKIDPVSGQKRAIQGGWFSNEAVRDQDELDRPLSKTLQGTIGRGVGEMLPLAPVNEGVESALGLTRAAPYVGRVLGSTLAKMGATGAVDAAAVGDVDKMGQEAATGAGLNLALGAAAGGLGRIARGIVKKSSAAEDLEHLASQQGKDIFIPVSQAGDSSGGDALSRTVQAFYKEGLPLIPGATGRIEKQAEDALGTFRQMALEEADPSQVLSAAAHEDGLVARRSLKTAFDDAYGKTINSYSFNVPSDLDKQIESKILAEHPNVDSTTLQRAKDAITEAMMRFSDGDGTIAGSNMMNVKQAIAHARSSMSHSAEKAALDEGGSVVEDIIENDLRQGNKTQNVADLDSYQHLSEPYSAFKDVSKAINAAKENRGKFTPAQLAKSSRDSSTLLDLASTANEVLGKPAIEPSTAGRVAAYSLGALGGWHNPIALLGAVSGANVLATRTIQKAVMGDTTAQRALTRLMQQHPEMIHKVRAIIQAGAPVAAVGGDNAGP